MFTTSKNIPIQRTQWHPKTPGNNHGKNLRDFVLTHPNAEYILFLDCDIVFVQDDTVTTMLSELESQDDVWAMQARFTHDGRSEWPGGSLNIGMKNHWQSNPGAFGRWFKKQLDPHTWSDIEATFAGADAEENWDAMFKTAEVFGRLASEVGSHLGYAYPIELDRNITAYLPEIRELGHAYQ